MLQAAIANKTNIEKILLQEISDCLLEHIDIEPLDGQGLGERLDVDSHLGQSQHTLAIGREQLLQILFERSSVNLLSLGEDTSLILLALFVQLLPANLLEIFVCPDRPIIICALGY